MDEVDSIGSARTENSGGGGDSEVQRTMLELLNQLDGFEATNKIKVRRQPGGGILGGMGVWSLISAQAPATVLDETSCGSVKRLEPETAQNSCPHLLVVLCNGQPPSCSAFVVHTLARKLLLLSRPPTVTATCLAISPRLFPAGAHGHQPH